MRVRTLAIASGIFCFDNELLIFIIKLHSSPILLLAERRQGIAGNGGDRYRRIGTSGQRDRS
jgi:hypothetical protein